MASDSDRKLFVGGLSWSTTNESLRLAFEKIGRIEEATIFTDAVGRSRGCGYVTYVSDADAQAAYKAMHGVKLDGRPLHVDRFRQDRLKNAYPDSGAPRGGPRDIAPPYVGRDGYDRDYDRAGFDRGSYDRMAYDSRGPGYPSGGAAGYGGYGMPPPRGGHPYPSTRGGYPSRGVGGFPPYAASRGGSFGGYDPYYPPGVRGGFEGRMDYYEDGGSFGRGRSAYPPQHSVYGRRARPYDYPPSSASRPYDSRYPEYDPRDIRERDHLRPFDDLRGRPYESMDRPPYDDRTRERERERNLRDRERSNDVRPHDSRGYSSNKRTSREREPRASSYPEGRPWSAAPPVEPLEGQQREKERGRDHDRDRIRDHGRDRDHEREKDSRSGKPGYDRRDENGSLRGADKHQNREKEGGSSSHTSSSRGSSSGRHSNKRSDVRGPPTKTD